MCPRGAATQGRRRGLDTTPSRVLMRVCRHVGNQVTSNMSLTDIITLL